MTPEELRKLQERSVQTAGTWAQGNIRGLDDAMTRRLVASTVMTESRGGSLTITNAQGYVGRYQAGAGWLADAGYVDAWKLHAAMKRDGFTSEWKWAKSGGMTRFLEDASNWTNGLSLEKYKASAELQDRAFKINCDAAVRDEIRRGGLTADSDPRLVAAFLKARHISGLGGAEMALRGQTGPADANGTSNMTYFTQILRNGDGLDAMMNMSTRQAPPPDALADGVLKRGENGEAVRHLQQRLNAHGLHGLDGKPIDTNGHFGPNTQAAVREFQRAHGLPVTGEANAATRAALDRAPVQHAPASQASTPSASQGDVGFDAAMRRMLPPQAGVKPHVTSPFHAERGAVDHQGVDFNYVGGQNGVNLRHPTVNAPASGTVIFVGGQYGTVKIRDAQGNVHEILHMQTQSVRKGDVVQAGDPIGTMGGRGPDGANQFAQHVHYQLRDPQNRIIDPVAFWNDPRHRELADGRNASPAPAPAAGAMRDGKLAFGESGPAVVQLQDRLNAFGIRDAEGRALPLTGNFRERTQAAVREFQRLHGLPDTGVADKATLDALAKSPEIKRGDHGPDVLHVQQMLERAGIVVPKTGTFTYLTEGGVKEFQATHGLEPTGVVSGQTLYELRRIERQATVAAPAPDASQARAAPSPVPGADTVPARQTTEARADHPFVAQARPLIEALDRDVGRTPDAQSERFIAGVAAKAQAEGLDRIDRIVLSTDRSRLIAVQEDGEARRIAAVDIRQVLDTPVEASIAQLAPATAMPAEREAPSRARVV